MERIRWKGGGGLLADWVEEFAPHFDMAKLDSRSLHTCQACNAARTDRHAEGMWRDEVTNNWATTTYRRTLTAQCSHCNATTNHWVDTQHDASPFVMVTNGLDTQGTAPIEPRISIGSRSYQLVTVAWYRAAGPHWMASRVSTTTDTWFQVNDEDVTVTPVTETDPPT